MRQDANWGTPVSKPVALYAYGKKGQMLSHHNSDATFLLYLMYGSIFDLFYAYIGFIGVSCPVIGSLVIWYPAPAVCVNNNLCCFNKQQTNNKAMKTYVQYLLYDQ